MLNLPEPDDILSAANIKDVAADVTGQLPLQGIEGFLAEVHEPDAAKRIMAAITYKEIDDLTQTDAAELDGSSSSWTSKWFIRLERLADEPFEEVVYNETREGRPSELSDKEHDQFVKALHGSPGEVGYDALAWSVPLARHYLSEEFGVEHCERHVRRLISEVGLSWKTARPEFDKSDERTEEAWQEGFKQGATTWTMNTRS